MSFHSDRSYHGHMQDEQEDLKERRVDHHLKTLLLTWPKHKRKYFLLCISNLLIVSIFATKSSFLALPVFNFYLTFLKLLISQWPGNQISNKPTSKKKKNWPMFALIYIIQILINYKIILHINHKQRLTQCKIQICLPFNKE